jgi:hypothetical protein
MAMYRSATVAAPITIIGKDLDAGATFNADLKAAQGVLKAGQIMKYDAALKELSKVTDFALDVPYGVLADDIDGGTGTEIFPVMVYRRGVFLRQELESANNIAITPGSALETKLNDAGIFFELSYEQYAGLSPVPAGVQPMGFGAEEEEAAAKKEEPQE